MRPRTTFVMISVSDRLEELNALIGQIKDDPRWDEIDISLMFQDTEGVAGFIKNRERIKHLFIAKEKLGCHGARVLLLQKIRYEAYINLDDDMVLGPATNYWPAVEKAMEPEVGFVMTAWARTPELLAKKLPNRAEIFTKQIMLYNGGGMAYSEKVAAMMRELPPVKTAFDCIWPITTYVNGLTNYYYYGSMSVHRVCGRGGMHQFMKDTPLHVMGQEWLRFRPLAKQNGSCHDVAVPLDGDVLPIAKALHKQRRMEKFGR